MPVRRPRTDAPWPHSSLTFTFTLESRSWAVHRCAGPPEVLAGAGAVVVIKPSQRSTAVNMAAAAAAAVITTATAATAATEAPMLQAPQCILAPVAWSPGAYPMGLPVSSLASASIP
jgi:hypothetical protein